MSAGRHTLVLAWGNPGRRDDGLGPALAERVARAELPGVTVESDYQLQVEDAAEVARHDRVLFVDADRSDGAGPFWVRRLEPAAAGAGFSTHSVSPGRLLALGRDLFGGRPEAWLIGIRGSVFDEYGEGLSATAAANLDAAAAFVNAVLEFDAVPIELALVHPEQSQVSTRG